MNSLKELQTVRERMEEKLAVRGYRPEDEGNRHCVLICGGQNCQSADSHRIYERFCALLRENGLDREIDVVQTGCHGMCEQGPLVLVYPEGAFYTRFRLEDVEEVVERHLKGHQIVEHLEYQENGKALSVNETAFYGRQQRVALHNCGHIDPESIEEYIGTGGYLALGKAVTEMTPDEVIRIVTDSGLRGRGGAGFPTGKKWEFASGSRGQVQKYVCCNADEGDPGAFMDRSILEGDPHVVLEAMAIAGYAIGSDQGYIYVRAEYPVAVQRLQIAIDQANEKGLLGDRLFGTDFSFRVELRLGAGAFVCGEETALMTSIEGHRGEPRPRPPFPAVKGLFGKPTILNNVETYANVPKIILNGAEWFRNLGTDQSKGTKVFALGGKINNTGLVEVPMGTTLRTIVEEIGGGIPNGKKFKAAQTGGPSGGCIPEEYLDVAMDYEHLAEIGSIMGSGGLIVMDEDNCMVDVAKFYLQFTVDESCGKCPPCRIGIKRMLDILEKITDGRGEMKDLDQLEKLAKDIKQNSLCGLGQTAPNPILSTLKFFRKEYEAHILEKRCPAHVCKALLQYEIDPELCRGCTLCAKNCPAGAISGEVKQPHVIDASKCIKCGVCMSQCRFSAVVRR